MGTIQVVIWNPDSPELSATQLFVCFLSRFLMSVSVVGYIIVCIEFFFTSVCVDEVCCDATILK